MPKAGGQQPRSPQAGMVGDRLRAMRYELEMTLSEMAKRTGVSVSNLSKIERGEVSPSFDVIMRICDGVGIPVEQFVKPGPKRSIFGRKTVTRLGEAICFSSAQYDYLAHSSELSHKSMVPLEIRVRARSQDDFDHWSQHDGEEYIYVIAGAIEVHTDQYVPFCLRQGESAYFDSRMKHVYVSIGESDAHVLSVSFNPHAAERIRIADFLNPAARLEEVKGGDADSGIPARRKAQ